MVRCAKTKCIALLCLLCVVCLSAAGALLANSRTASAESGVGTSFVSEERARTSLNEGWKFYRADADGAQNADFDDAAWESVALPHTWNSEDYYVNSYYKGKAWYRRVLRVQPKSYYQANNTRLWVEFEACGQYADVYLNGQKVGSHIGGYSAFRFDLTDLLSESGENLLAVCADNSGSGSTISPFGMDFTVWGGLYRDAWLVEASAVGVDLSDHGSSGLYVTATKDDPSDNADKAWALNVKAKITNASDAAASGSAVITLRYPKESDLHWIDPQSDYAGTAAIPAGAEGNPLLFDRSAMFETFATEEEFILQTVTVPLEIAAGDSVSLDEDFSVQDPKLWDGVRSPYRYVAEVRVVMGGETVDHVKEMVGFRYTEVNERGFFLNGRLYPLNGVGTHQDFGGSNAGGEIFGYATTAREKEIDFSLAYEMGVNYLRLAHYPYDRYVYELCDAYGIVVWTEVALGGSIGGSTTYGLDDPVTVQFFENVKLQLEELIKQQYNSPCIVMWGLQNEVNARYYDVMAHYMQEMHDLVRALDGYGRYTTQAVCVDGQVGWKSDLIAWNFYPLWYTDSGYAELVAGIYDDFRSDPRYAQYLGVGISEYGAGANIEHHTDQLVRPETTGQWHPEEWQNYVHEQALLAYAQTDFLWGNSPWNLFDFGSGARDEGDQKGINDKGFITFDRTVKKDVFYLYKANYSQMPFVYLAEKRFDPRERGTMRVKVYSNADRVMLYREESGEKQLLGEMTACGAGIFVLNDVPLEYGENIFVAEADGGQVSDRATFERIRSRDTALTSTRLSVDNENKTVVLDGNLTVGELKTVLRPAYEGASYVVLPASGDTPLDDAAVVVPSMRVLVTAEDTSVSTVYTLVSANISADAEMTSSLASPPDFAPLTDGDISSRWVADSTSFSLTIDLKQEYRLTDLEITWYTAYATRYYLYTVSVSRDNASYTTVVDRSRDSVRLDTTQTVLTLRDDLGEQIGRYVRIEVVGCNIPVGRTEINEIEIYGWNMESDTLRVDHNNRVITWTDVPQSQDERALNVFLDQLRVTGNATYSIGEGEATLAYYVQEGNCVILTDGNGKEIRYYICLNCGDAHTAPRRIPDAAVKADAQLNGFFGAENVLDGREDTKWVGSRFDFEDAALFFTLPERTEVESIRILFDGAGDRAYDYRVWASAGGLRQDDFRLAAEVIGNKDRSGEAVVTIQRSIRYIRIEVLGCDEANASPAVCEVEILGYRDCTFTFVTGGGSPIDEAVYPLGAEVAPIPEREGYRFGGWFLDSGCMQPFAGRAQADTVLYAKWDAIEYTISFRSNGGTELQPLVGKAGDALVLPVPTREGFTFTGWYADAQCTVRCEVDRMPEGGLVLYAGWGQNADAADVPSEGCASAAMGGVAFAGVLLLVGSVVAAIVCRRKGGLQK